MPLQRLSITMLTSIGTYKNRTIFWADYGSFANDLPAGNWIWLAAAESQPDLAEFEKNVRTAIARNVLVFKGYGKFGELLHDYFDEVLVYIEVVEQQPEADVTTTWHNDESLADTFWEACVALGVPDTVDFDDLKIVFTDLDGEDRKEELESYLKEFKLGWLPGDNIKHEVWQDETGLSELCFSGPKGDGQRKLMERGKKIVYEFYAASYFEAMNEYYRFMDWGEWETCYEEDKKPYENMK